MIEPREPRQRIAQVSASMLSGDMPFLEGAHELASLRHQIKGGDDDQDFRVFVAIASETDHLPLGPSRQYWAEDALRRHQPEFDAATTWAKQWGMNACESLARRFSAYLQPGLEDLHP